jgi:hypothetical protein
MTTKLTVVHRKWRRNPLGLVVTKEYKRVMKLLDFDKKIIFKHKIVWKRVMYRRDGDPYDVVEIKYD